MIYDVYTLSRPGHQLNAKIMGFTDIKASDSRSEFSFFYYINKYINIYINNKNSDRGFDILNLVITANIDGLESNKLK